MSISLSNHRSLRTISLLLLISHEVYSQSVNIGDKVCAAGYIMDTFCIDRGNLLDRPSLETLSPQGPPGHSVHCLVDIGICNGSPYEVLKELEDGSYGRAWRVDNNELLLTHARANGVCSNCAKENSAKNGDIVDGYRATVVGTVRELAVGEIPPVISVSSVADFDDFENICQGDENQTLDGSDEDVDETHLAVNETVLSTNSSEIVMSLNVSIELNNTEILTNAGELDSNSLDGNDADTEDESENSLDENEGEGDESVLPTTLSQSELNSDTSSTQKIFTNSWVAVLFFNGVIMLSRIF